MINKFKKHSLHIVVFCIFLIASCAFTQIFITSEVFKPKYRIMGSGVTLDLSLEELYNSSDKFVKCTPMEILPAKWTTFGDENATMTIITTDIIMKITNHTSTTSGGEDTFVLRIAGGNVDEIEMVDEENILSNINVGTEYLMFLTSEQVPANLKDSNHRSDINDKTIYRAPMNGADGIFKQETKVRGINNWASLNDRLIVTNSNLNSMEYK